MLAFDGKVTVGLACRCGHRAVLRIDADTYFADRPWRRRLVCSNCGRRPETKG